MAKKRAQVAQVGRGLACDSEDTAQFHGRISGNTRAISSHNGTFTGMPTHTSFVSLRR